MILASGSAFSKATTPKVVVRVGKSGDTGSVAISNMIFSTVGGSSGAIIMECAYDQKTAKGMLTCFTRRWNIAAKSAGDAGLWDAHFRLGTIFRAPDSLIVSSNSHNP